MGIYSGIVATMCGIISNVHVYALCDMMVQIVTCVTGRNPDTASPHVYFEEGAEGLGGMGLGGCFPSLHG